MRSPENAGEARLDSAGKPPQAFDWLAIAAMVGLFVVTRMVERGGAWAPRALGLAVLLVAMPLVFVPFVHLKRHGLARPGGSYMDTTRVAQRGIYGVVRHPQYLGYVLFAAGLALISQSLVGYAVASLAAALFYIHTLQEEAYCRRLFGAGYDAYCRSVPRFNLLLGVVRCLKR